MKNILTVDNLNVSYGKNEIIKNLSFSVKKTNVTIILGPNGAGKTTLLRAILNLIPYQGIVSWQTKKISYLPPQEFLQRKNLPPLNIKDFFKFKNVTTEQIISHIQAVGLNQSILNQQFNSLSTGQFQRMIIAWSLVDNPDVLIFDEPTSGIDIKGEENIYSLIHKFWQEKQLTIILVTHDLNIVWEHANQVICLNKEYICMGKPENVLTPEKLKLLYGTGLKYYKHHHHHHHKE